MVPNNISSGRAAVKFGSGGEDYCGMRTSRSFPIVALTLAGLLWGTTVPMTKVALGWLGPTWLTVARFALAALPLALVARRHLRAALTPAVVAWGAVGYGAVIVAQNAGIARTSVSHAALLVGTVPILVALMAVGLGRSRVGPLAWAGFGLALAGVVLVAADGSGGASLSGDALVGASLVLSAAFVVAQPRLLRGRDVFAVTAVQFGAAALAALPFAGWLDGAPPAPTGGTAPALVAALVLAGTLVPFTLFAYAQAHVTPDVAGAFLNLEPLVGAAAGVVVFGEPAGVTQVLGGLAIVAGIGLPLLRQPRFAAVPETG
jgi:drug/metabolite transporter (DMT)-like permease